MLVIAAFNDAAGTLGATRVGNPLIIRVLGKHGPAPTFKPVVDRTFPLKDTRAAHEYMQSSQMFGKIVLVP